MKKDLQTIDRSQHMREAVFLGWLALVSAICFLVLIVLQLLEMSYYGNSPSLWPS